MINGVAQVGDIAHLAVFYPLLVGEVEVKQHDHTGLGVQSRQGDDANPHRDTHIVAEPPDRRERAHQRKGNGQHHDCGLDGRAGVEVNNQDDEEEGERDNDHEALPGLEHVFVLTAPKNAVARRPMDLPDGDGVVDGAHGRLHVTADVNAFNIDVYPGVGHGAFAFDAHRGVDGFDFRQLPQRHLRPAGRWHDDVAQRPEILAEVAAVAKIDLIALQTLDCGRQRQPAQRHFQHVLHVAHTQAVTGDGVAVNRKLDVVPPHRPFGERAQGAGHCFYHRLDFGGDALQLRQIRPGDLDAHGRLDAGRQHVDARPDRHRPRVVEAGDLHRGVHRVRQFIRRPAAMGDDFAAVVLDVDRRPFLLRFQHDGGFDHVERSRICGRLGAPSLAKNILHFGEPGDDSVSRLQDLPRFGGRNAGESRGHIQQIAFVKWRHEFGADVLVREKLPGLEGPFL